MSQNAGTSAAYTRQLLAKKAPELYQRVIAGEMSANAAAIQAGLLKVPTPFEQVLKLWPKLTTDEQAHIMALNQ